ncbi:hypothetical protein [Natronolimnobius baerhuensis]|uniref:hypothetical protein n=1 Tax=Natronolimnobius baerhuensis TaxID=253108 RepID=UPI001FEA7205|nr:hypothetical protein [Natronolimnobius baerhuensis]
MGFGRSSAETYNTAMFLAAVERLEVAGVETAFTGERATIRDALDSLWNGQYFDEHRASGTLACDANVVALYFGLVNDDRAASIIDALASLERVEHVLGRYGTVLECYTLAGEPYITRGYASAGNFTVAAALWTEYYSRR